MPEHGRRPIAFYMTMGDCQGYFIHVHRFLAWYQGQFNPAENGAPVGHTTVRAAQPSEYGPRLAYLGQSLHAFEFDQASTLRSTQRAFLRLVGSSSTGRIPVIPVRVSNPAHTPASAAEDVGICACFVEPQDACDSMGSSFSVMCRWPHGAIKSPSLMDRRFLSRRRSFKDARLPLSIQVPATRAGRASGGTCSQPH